MLQSDIYIKTNYDETIAFGIAWVENSKLLTYTSLAVDYSNHRNPPPPAPKRKNCRCRKPAALKCFKKQC